MMPNGEYETTSALLYSAFLPSFRRDSFCRSIKSEQFDNDLFIKSINFFSAIII